MDNKIEQYSIGELLDGRYFFIPAYQRGYRWTEKQVGDLLRDLLCFANDKKDDFDFYCLQPVIARPITSEDKIVELFGEEVKNDVLAKGAWEIIDGQQRLTTLFLIYRYLLKKLDISAEELYETDERVEYHLHYATRPDSTTFLESLDLSTLKLEDFDNSISCNIDFYHMGCAFKYIDEWMLNEGREINKRYKLGPSTRKICESLLSILNGARDNKDGSVQVLWYQLDEVNAKSSIKEFQKINTGIIRLTNAELIKGLFLLEKNFQGASSAIRKSELALEWEFIENTLHNNSFWYFLQKKGTDMPNRIDLLFTLIYKCHKLEDISEDELDLKLKEIDQTLNETNQDDIFRYYYNMFEGKYGDELQNEVSSAWNEVMTLFRTLDDWFCTPAIYNYIGLLSQCGEDLAHLVVHFNKMSEDSKREDFEKYLVERIRFQLRGVKFDPDTKEILTKYKEHNNIFKMLLTLNIHLLNQQNSKFESDSDVYKFPFDVLNAQDWDIEHIDSFHTNALKGEDDKKEWIATAIADLPELSEEIKTEVNGYLQNKQYDSAISKLKAAAHEVDPDDERKNSIGNLTLLDSSTNRKYGNSLFCTKRKIIIERMKQGVFVPTGTQYIFYKFFDPSGTNRSQWTDKDMEEYHKYVYDNIIEYLKSNTDGDE